MTDPHQARQSTQDKRKDGAFIDVHKKLLLHQARHLPLTFINHHWLFINVVCSVYSQKKKIFLHVQTSKYKPIKPEQIPSLSSQQVTTSICPFYKKKKLFFHPSFNFQQPNMKVLVQISKLCVPQKCWLHIGVYCFLVTQPRWKDHADIQTLMHSFITHYCSFSFLETLMSQQ